MGLYDRLLGRDDLGARVQGKIAIHSFQALMAEVARGRLTGAQARDLIPSIAKGVPLTASEASEASTLLGTISGSGTARLARAKEIDDVLLLGERGATGYSTPTEVKTRLGV